MYDDVPHGAEKDRVILDEALGHAYEGLVITGAEGIIRKVNRASRRAN